MSNMKDVDRSVFSEASHGSFDFDEQEIARIGDLAKGLGSILAQAKQREQEKIGQYK
jgi:hypothetical protein